MAQHPALEDLEDLREGFFFGWAGKLNKIRGKVFGKVRHLMAQYATLVGASGEGVVCFAGTLGAGFLLAGERLMAH